MQHNRPIRNIAIIGSGIMGSRIACHFANIGVKVLLLDIVPRELTENEIKLGLQLEDKKIRNRIVNEALQSTLKSNPAALYQKNDIRLITTGNIDDDLQQIKECDWILEAVVERLDIKKQLFEKIALHRKVGSIVSSNTSGIPIQMMEQGMSDEMRSNFCGTHFFNPPRYLRLLEIIPGSKTDPKLIDFLVGYGEQFLGKTSVICKDTPAFIANRIGVFSILSLFHLVERLDLGVEEIDKLTGPIVGRPKSATFRTCDVVGLDTLVHVANGLKDHVPNDTRKEIFHLPNYIQQMINSKWFGDKTKQGFYKKSKGEDGKSVILSLNFKTMEYEGKKKIKFETLEGTKNIEDLRERLPVLFAGKDKAGQFYRESFCALFQYIAERIPEIADEPYKIDAAMMAGFGWEIGPFEIWDILGVNKCMAMISEMGLKVPSWLTEMIAEGNNQFYKVENGNKLCYQPLKKGYEKIPGSDNQIQLQTIRKRNLIWTNNGCNIIDIGDGIICCEFATKMNTIGTEVVMGVNKAIEIAEESYRGLVISNDAANFSAGANLAMVFMMAIEQEFDEIDFAVRAFQNMNMRVRYSSIPVVVAPFGLSLGGGCEMSLHADKVQAHAELYTGLVEFGVGLIPGGGGSKEFALRFSDAIKEGDIELNTLRNRFLTIAQAKVSTSAKEAYELGILRNGIDEITLNRSRLIAEAKNSAIKLAESGYTQPVKRKDIKVLGKSGLGLIHVGANSMLSGNYISKHDQLICQKLGNILCGGNLSSPTLVSEQYLLDLEREAFLSLCGEKKTLERIQSILTTGKPLRN